MNAKLVIKPILAYSTSVRKEATSWRPWGGIQTEADAVKEEAHINAELSALNLDFPVKILPLSLVKNLDQARSVQLDGVDLVIIYGATGDTELIRSFISEKRWTILFLRHKSGPLYPYYEFAHAFLLRRWTDEVSQPGIGLDDVVVDDYDELVKKIRALNGLKGALGRKVVVVGGPSSLFYGQAAADRAKEKWGIEIKTVPYEPDLGDRIKKKMGDPRAVERAKELAQNYLSSNQIKLSTKNEFVINAFILYQVFEDLLNEAGADAITINECMTTIIPMARTTACLPLSLLNDEGKIAVCEGDLVSLPAFSLLHEISNRPVFLNDPTFPHNGVVTVAHCTSPTMLNGKDRERTNLVTHYESDFGAAPKVEFEKGQEVTVLDADFGEKIWVGFKGKVVESTAYPTCRSQMDIEIEGDWKKLLSEMRGFHWVLVYGDFLDEAEYALKKVGIELRRI